MQRGNIAAGIVLAHHVGPPQNAAWVKVVAGHDNAVVVGLEEAAVDQHVLGTRYAKAVTADAFDLMQAQVGKVNVFGVAVFGVVVVGANDLKIAAFTPFHAEKSDRDDVNAVGASGCVTGHIHALLRAGVHHADRALTRDFDVVQICALDQGQIANVQAMRPVNAGDHAVMPVGYLIVVIIPQLGLPQHRAVSKVKLDVRAHQNRGGNVSTTVKIVRSRQQHASATGSSHAIDGVLNGFSVVVHRVTVCTAIGDRNCVVGQVKCVRILVKILVIFNVKALAQAKRLAALDLCKGDELIGQQRGVLVIKRNVVHAKVCRQGALANQTLTRRGFHTRSRGRVCHGGGVNADHTACVIGQLRKVRLAAYLDRLCLGVSHARSNAARVIDQRLFLLKGVAVNDDVAFALGAEGKLQQSAVAAGRVRKIEVVCVGLIIIGEPEGLAITTFVQRGLVAQRCSLGGGAVGQHHKYRVAARHEHVVGRARMVGEQGRGQRGSTLQGKDHLAALVGQRAALDRVKVRLRTYQAKVVQRVSVRHGHLHLGNCPLGIIRARFQRHAHGHKAHFAGGEQAVLLGHVADRAEGFSIRSPKRDAAKHALARGLLDHKARGACKARALLGGEGNFHGCGIGSQRPRADFLCGLKNKTTLYLILRKLPAFGRKGIVGLSNLFVCVFVFD